MPRILFVCTANLYRSPLAAALLSKKLQADEQSRRWRVASAGTWTVTGQRLPTQALAAARAMGLDLSSHLTRQVDHDLLAKFDLILVMEKGHREALRIEFPFIQERVHLLSELADQMEYDISDPATSGWNVEKFAEAMGKLIDRAYANICRLAWSHETIPSSTGRNVNFTL